MSTASKSALVTGASSGIGRAAALHLDSLGWTVFAGVRRREDGQALAAGASERLEPLILDVTRDSQVRSAADEVAEAVGESGLDGLVNNAGIFTGGPIELIPMDDFRQALDVNLTGHVAVTQAVLPLVRRARGRIVFVGSVGGRITTPFGSPYHASKWGLEAVAECLRAEVAASGVEVSTVEPGAVATEIWSKGAEYGAEARTRFDEERERLYGADIDAMIATALEEGEKGLPAERVARVIERALTASRPRAHYLVGRDARMGVAVHAMVGARRWTSLVRRQMRMP